MFLEIILLVGTAALVLYLWQRHAYTYWQRHNVKFIPPKFFVGNFGALFTLSKSFDVLFTDLHNDASLSSKDAVVGIYNCFRPQLLLRDVELIKRIFIKDFSEFTNRPFTVDAHHGPLGSNNLAFARDDNWRILRPKLSPVFTSGKIKQMYPLMTEVGRELETLLQTFPNGTIIDVKEVSSRFTNEMIGTIAFGIRAGSLRDPNSAFYRHSLLQFEATAGRAFDLFCTLLVPELAPLLRVKIFPEKFSRFMRDSIGQIAGERERTGVKRNDLIDALISMKHEAEKDADKTNPAHDFDFLVAQAAIFQAAGFETSSSTMTFALYELALQPDLQERLHAEIRNAFEEAEHEQSEISYEKLQELPYLSQVVDETLRKYPIGSTLPRECTPTNGKKGYSLAPFSNFVIPAGMGVFVSALAIQRDERYWPDPEKFDPERFAPENRKNLNMAAYLPFGAGPRNCIGSRIGLLQTKLGMVHLLKDYRVVTCDKTPKVIEFDPRTNVLTSKTNIVLKLELIEN